MAIQHRLEEPRANIQVSVLVREQTCLRWRMVTRSHCSRAARFKIHGGRKHETHRWRCAGVALAHVRRVGHHALRDGTDHGNRSGGQEFCRRRKEERSLVFPEWSSAFDPRSQSRRLRIPARFRRRRLFRVGNGVAERFHHASADRNIVEKFRGKRNRAAECFSKRTFYF